MSVLKIKVKRHGKNTKKWLEDVSEIDFHSALITYAEKGVNALRKATPVDSGLTARSWYYEIEQKDAEHYIIRWLNSNVNRGINIALLIQMGHGTGTGGWVEGRDYINPAMQPLFDELANKLWAEVTEE